MSTYRNPVYRDGEGGHHVPGPGETTVFCDAKSMFNPYDPSQEIPTETAASGTSKSNGHSNDNLWNRSFYDHPGARTILEQDFRTMGRGCRRMAHALIDSYKASQSFMQSCFRKSGRTQSKRNSVSTLQASDHSASSSDIMKHFTGKDGYPEKGDGDGSSLRRRAGRGEYPDCKAGSRLE
jgi:hypothetical protein